MNPGTARIFAGVGAARSHNGTPSLGGLFRLAVDRAWEALDNGLPAGAEVHAILARPDDPNVIFAGTGDGPWGSTDGGDHWHKLNFPEPNVMIWSLTIHPTRPSVMYAGSAPIVLYRSLDGGDTWHRLRNAVSPAHCERAGFDSRVPCISVDPNRPDDVYAAPEVSGVIRGTDGGETWSDMSAPLMRFAAEPRYQSNVGGRHRGLCEGMLDSHATAVSPAAFSTDGSLYRSQDLGATWRRIDRGVKAESTLMAVSEHPADPARLSCVTRGGQVFGTEDGGESWREFRLPDGVEDVYAVARA